MAIRGASRSITRILVADGDPHVRRLFARKLRYAGYQVNAVKSGGEALRLLRAMCYRLLVLNLDMPGIDGFDVLKAVRSELPHVQVLVVSGYRQSALLEAAEFLGARLALDKASAPRLLVETARRLLGDH